uniref:G-protein coupled receptors family 1 profile domain-containing protein n=1 Tax=Periophthalmus magnuspinnatus TaxID=409849 RepID=A0A3B3ZI82_9GOBI
VLILLDLSAAFDTFESWTSSWSTEDPFTEDYDGLMCERSEVLQFRAGLEPVLFWTVAVLGLAGNLLVLWVYLWRGRGVCGGRGLKALTHLYLLHLCAADLFFLLTLPLWAHQSTEGWTLGAPLCKVTAAMYKVNLFSVSLFLACIAVDRYVVIVHPTAALNSQRQRRNWARGISVSVWLLALLLATPELAFATVTAQDDHMTCRTQYPAHWGRVGKATALSLQVSLGFFVPLVVMAGCYLVIGRRLLMTHTFHKHRPLLVIMAIVLVFIITQLPHNCVLITEIWDAHTTSLNCADRKVLDKTGLVLQAVAFSHPALNPFLYALIGRRFRQELMSLLPRSSTQKKNISLSFKNRPRTLSDSETSQGLSL